MPRTKIRTPEMTDNILLNSDTYFDYLDRLKKIALSIFEWQNLPSSMDARYLENILYYDGQAAIFFDEELGFINTRAAGAGYLNIYGIPTEFNCFSFSYHKNRKLYSGLNQDLDNTGADGEMVLVMNTNNFRGIPTAHTVELYALRLAEAQRTCDVNIKAMRTPVLILTDEKQRRTLEATYQQYNENKPVIYGDKNIMTTDAIKVMKTDAPFVALNVKEYMREIWNEALTFLGIANLQEKRERLVESEVSSNNELVNLNLQSYLAPRKQACKEFNRKYGTNIDVKVRSDLHNIIKQAESIVSEYQDTLEVEDATTDLGEGIDG